MYSCPWRVQDDYNYRNSAYTKASARSLARIPAIHRHPAGTALLGLAARGNAAYMALLRLSRQVHSLFPLSLRPQSSSYIDRAPDPLVTEDDKEEGQDRDGWLPQCHERTTVSWNGGTRAVGSVGVSQDIEDVVRSQNRRGLTDIPEPVIVVRHTGEPVDVDVHTPVSRHKRGGC